MGGSRKVRFFVVSGNLRKAGWLMKKRSSAGFVFILLLLFLLPISANAANNPYSTRQTFDYNGRTYTTVPCTWYAWQQVYDRLGIALPIWGNGGDWYENARKSGYAVGSTPQVNSLIVWTDSGWGHVGFVTAVNGNSVTFNEGGTANRRANSLGIYEGHTIPDGYTSGCTYFSSDERKKGTEKPPNLRRFVQ